MENEDIVIIIIKEMGVGALYFNGIKYQEDFQRNLFVLSAFKFEGNLKKVNIIKIEQEIYEKNLNENFPDSLQETKNKIFVL